MKLLIGYDGSPFADAAIDDLVTAGLPAAGVRATVLSVADVWPTLPPLYRETLTPAPTETTLAVADAARQMADRAQAEAGALAEAARARVAALFPGWAVDAEAVSDSPASAITERAESLGADLIVIGSHGRGALARMFFGSISQKVLRYAHCSVRVARKVEARKPGPLRVVLGLDTSDGAAAALDAVASRPWPSETRVHVVTAVDVRLATSIPIMEAPVTDAATGYVSTDENGWLRDAQERAAGVLRAAGLHATCLLKDGDPKHVLLHEADDWHADLIVVGAKGISRIERFLLGSVSGSIAARAHCTVEVVRFE